MHPSRVWYLAYGSNISPDRFRLYLEGGVTEPGARDATPPSQDRFLQLPLRLDFALESQRWSGGGVAFVHPDESRQAWFRAWNISAEQFEDVFSQENRRAVGTPLPWQELLSGDRAHLDEGDGWYRRVHVIDPAAHSLDAPALTFSTPQVLATNPPHDEYRSTIARGLADHVELDAAAIEAYLDASTLDDR